MGSPPEEIERRGDETQVAVTLSRGFWVAKFEATQGQWTRVVGKFPGKQPTLEFGAGDDFPAYWINFNDAESFCQKLTERAFRSDALPKGWEFRLPTEAQWRYACRAGTVTATSFGHQLGRHQANFKGQPFNGGRDGPPVGRCARVGSYPANPGASATCTAMSSSGAGTGITRACRAARIPTCTTSRGRPIGTEPTRASGAVPAEIKHEAQHALNPEPNPWGRLPCSRLTGADVQDLPELFENNRRWAARCVAARPDFFDKLKAQQAPE